MHDIILYASCHCFSNNEDTYLTGGINVGLPYVPNVIPFYSTVHLAQWDSGTMLKGGEMEMPASLASISGTEDPGLFDGSGGFPEIKIPGISALAAGICDDFGGQVDGLVGSLGKAKGMLNSPFDMLRGELNGLSGAVSSPINDLTSGLDSITDAALDGLPGLPDVSELERIMQACGLLRGSLLGGLMSPAEFLGKYLNTALGLLDSLVGGAMGAIGSVLGLIEAGAAFILNEINKLLNMLDISGLLSKLDGFLNCIEAICGRNFNIPSTPGAPAQPTSEKFYLDYIDDTMDYVNNMLIDMNLDDTGNLDINQMFAEIKNVPQDIFDNISTLADKAVEEADKGKEALVAMVDDMKPMVDDIITGLEETAKSFSGTNEEMLAVVEEKEEEVKELVVTLEETVNEADQEKILAKINSVKKEATVVLNPVIQKAESMQSFFT